MKTKLFQRITRFSSVNKNATSKELPNIKRRTLNHVSKEEEINV